MFLFLKFAHRQRPKYSKWLHPEKERKKHGNEWLQKCVMFQMILLEKCQNMKDLFDQWQ